MIAENELLTHNKQIEKIYSIGSNTYEKIWIQGVSITLLVMGFINIFSAWVTPDAMRLKLLKSIFEYQLIIGSRFIVLVIGIIALLVAPALFRRKRAAWYISIFLLGFSGFAHLMKGIDIIEASLCIFLLGILLPLFKYCYVKSDPIRMMQGWKLLLATLIFVIIYTFLGMHIFSHNLGLNPNELPIWYVGLNALLFDTSALNPDTFASKFFVDSLLWINGFALILGTILSLSPVIARQFTPKNLDLAKEIASKNSVQPVQHFVLNKDYQLYYYSDDKSQGYIGYQVQNDVAMAIGNPCFTTLAKPIINDWINFAIEYDWLPAVYQAKEDILPLFRKYEFASIPIGVEAIVNLETFTTKGKAMQDLRSAVNKANKNGWVIREYQKQDWSKIENLNQGWLRIHGHKEIGFAMGKASPEYLESTRTVLIVDAEDNLLAYVNHVDLPGINGRAVDLMRRSVDSQAGVMEALLTTEILKAQEEKKVFYDLGFSPLAQIDESFTDSKVAVRLLKLIYENQKRYYDFQGLHNFKAKFTPEWHNSFLIYPGAIHLPQVLLALLNLNRRSG